MHILKNFVTLALILGLTYSTFAAAQPQSTDTPPQPTTAVNNSQPNTTSNTPTDAANTQQKTGTTPSPSTAPSAPAVPTATDSSDQLKINVTSGWVRRNIPPTNNAAGYITIENPNTKDVVLLGMNAPDVANSVEMHNNIQDAGVMKMVKF